MTLVLCAVAIDYDGEPVTVSWSGDTRRNIILWMDHRAVKQAERINSFKSPVLEYCGGAVSPEMEPPKVLLQTLSISSLEYLKYVSVGGWWFLICIKRCYWYQTIFHFSNSS